MVVHVNFPYCSGRPVVWVTRTGPPAVPAGSIVPDSAMTRLGSVGPSTEQWYGVADGEGVGQRVIEGELAPRSK